ncbi:hypothetical protein ACELLULO517_27085, partial [Acidisoma cellulosilytica]
PYALRLCASLSSATLENLHIVRRVTPSQANIWSRLTEGKRGRKLRPLAIISLKRKSIKAAMREFGIDRLARRLDRWQA